MTAPHLRGRVCPPLTRPAEVRDVTITRQGDVVARGKIRVEHVRDHYWFEVVNHFTDKVVYRSDAFGFQDAMTQCAKAVEVARQAWSMGLRKQDLQ